MLRFMRKYATGWLIKGLFGIIIIVFVLYFGSTNLRQTDKVVAEGGSKHITLTEYIETYNKIFNFYRSLYRDKFDEKELKLKEKTMDELVNRLLLIKKAEGMGVYVSDEEFSRYLEGIDAFKRDGKFDKAMYLQVLQKSGIDPKKFEETERTNMLISKVTSIIGDNGVNVTERDVWDDYVKEKGRVNLYYGEFDPASFKDKVTIDDKEVDALYEKEKGSFKTEAVYRLKYLVIDEKSTVKDDKAYMDLLKLKNIDEYGKKNGLEVFETGRVKIGELTKRFQNIKIEQHLKGMKKGDISLPVRDGLKSYIFMVVDLEGERPLEKADIIKELKERLVYEKAKVLAKNKAEEAIREKRLEFRNETGFIMRNSTEIPRLGQIDKGNTDLFSLTKERPIYEKPVEISGKYYVFSYKDEKQPDPQEWEKEKKAYRNYVVAKKKEEFFKKFLDDLKNKEKVKIYWKEI
ncbi:MAG: SurA N-terminal domain-containing protein [Syntrophorhabdaceae bacterium]|nr:SurA N-terminal domain-containing protein [Syntrophorhabdaceae bacterium]